MLWNLNFQSEERPCRGYWYLELWKTRALKLHNERCNSLFIYRKLRLYKTKRMKSEVPVAPMTINMYKTLTQRIQVWGVMWRNFWSEQLVKRFTDRRVAGETAESVAICNSGKGTILLGRPRCSWEHNRKMDFTETECERVNWTELPDVGPMAGCTGHGNRKFGAHESGKYADHLRNYKLKKNPRSRNSSSIHTCTCH